MRLIKKLLSVGLIRVLVALAIMPALGYVWLNVTGHLDPGPLSAMSMTGEPLNGYDSHADFEQECTHCHAPIHCVTPTKCQDCHLEISQQLTDHDGLHSMLPGTDKCQTCHHEHNGREAYLTSMPVSNIDHMALTTFSLEKHMVDADGNTMTCENCHEGGVFEFSSEKCHTCHNTENGGLASGHKERFGDDCRICHDGVDRMQDFDHDLVFALDGQHSDLECEKCHVNRTFEGMAQDCDACHQDDTPAYHTASFGSDCARCHDAAAWTPAQLRQHAFRLDHAQDASITCDTCHPQAYVQHTCVACHEYDEQVLLEQHTEVDDGDIELTECTECHITGIPGEIAEWLERQEQMLNGAVSVPAQPEGASN